MDRNQSIGLILISLIVLGYFVFFAPKPPKTAYENPKTDSLVSKRQERLAKANAANTATLPTVSDSAAQAEDAARLGEFAAAARGTAQSYRLENKNVQVTISSRGGQFQRVWLKNFKTFDKKPLILLDSASSHESLVVQTSSGKKVDLRELYYNGQLSGNTLRLTAALGPNQSVEQTYTLDPNGYTVKYGMRLSGISQALADQPARYNWHDNIKRNEYDLQTDRTRTTINYYLANDNAFEQVKASVDPQQEKVEQPVRWVAHKEKFFTAAVIADEPFASADLRTTVDPKDSSVVKRQEAVLTIPAKNLADGALSMTYFFGPNNFKVLKDVAPDFQKNLDLGWGIFAWVNKLIIINVFHFLEGFISNYGIIIVLLVLFIKAITFPLTYKSYVSMAKMKVLKPELDEIKERNKDDMQKTQQETMSLYSKMGVNPISGCIPMLLSLPILMAMFSFFPNSIELRQEPFLWANDLSTYDVFARLPFAVPFYGSHVSMFTLLMTASTLLYTWSNNQVSTMQGPMKTYTYIMPLFFMFIVNSLPAGLSFYYFVANIVTFGQQTLIKLFVDEKKIRTKLEENAVKNVNKKKSGFQQRLEEAMRASQDRAEASKNAPAPKPNGKPKNE